MLGNARLILHDITVNDRIRRLLESPFFALNATGGKA